MWGKLNSQYLLIYKVIEAVIYDPSRMTCSINYSHSKIINIIIVVTPLVLVLTFALYTLIRCYKYFQAYPETLTDNLFCILNSTNKVVPLYHTPDIQS